MTNLRKYGWIPDRPSQVPWFNHARLLAKMPPGLPVKTNNRPFVKWVYEQTDSDCTANSGVAAERFFRATHCLPDFLGSRRFLYYATRSLEGSTGNDNGASIADTVTAEQKFGVCLETLWPYSKKLTVKPTTAAYKDALNHQVLVKAPVEQTELALEACIAAGQPVHYGMTVYQSFESDAVAASGKVPMPKKREAALGGHALYLFDYDRPKKLFYGQNSWGPQWGMGGLGIYSIPFAYILDPDYASDFWTVSKVE
jgi:C1A family cysteine protease